MFDAFFNVARAFRMSRDQRKRKNPQRDEFFVLSRLSIARLTRRGEYVDGTKGVDSTSEYSQLRRGACIGCKKWKRTCEQTAWKRTKPCKYHTVIVYLYTPPLKRSVQTSLIHPPVWTLWLLVKAIDAMDSSSLEQRVRYMGYETSRVGEEKKEGSTEKTIDDKHDVPFSQNSRSGEKSN